MGHRLFGVVSRDENVRHTDAAQELDANAIADGADDFTSVVVGIDVNAEGTLSVRQVHHRGDGIGDLRHVGIRRSGGLKSAQELVAKVAERRRLSADAAGRLADGRVFTAQQALAHGLVDRVGYMPDALALARQAAGVSEARVIVYQRPRQYRATYYARAEGPGGGLEASVSQLAALAAPGPRFLYLWWP